MPTMAVHGISGWRFRVGSDIRAAASPAISRAYEGEPEHQVGREVVAGFACGEAEGSARGVEHLAEPHGIGFRVTHTAGAPRPGPGRGSGG